MDRRQRPRRPCHIPATMTVLGPERVQFGVILEDWSASGVRVSLNRALRPGLLVQIQCEDCLFLGEVVYSGIEMQGYGCGVRVEQCLEPVSGLKRLVEALVGERAPDGVRG